MTRTRMIATSELAKVLNLHNIETKMANGRVMALDESTFEGELITTWVDVTKWSTKQLRIWLGY